MRKQPTQLDYVTVAASDDDTRPNLQGVYRDIDCLVATNGHRLHWANCQDKIEKGYYLNGYKHGDFPKKWKEVLPTKAGNSLSLEVSKDEIKTLKALLRFLCVSANEKRAVVRVTIESGKLCIASNFKKVPVTATITLNISRCDIKFELGLDLGYFIDAIEMPSTLGPIDITLIDELSPVRFSHLLGNAIVMPCRL